MYHRPHPKLFLRSTLPFFMMALGFFTASLSCDPSVGPLDETADIVPDADDNLDPALGAPVLNSVPTAVGAPFLTVRGRADGRRLYAVGITQPVTTNILPDGSFCIDVPLAEPGEYEVRFFSQSTDGRSSAIVGPFRVKYAAGASLIPLCNGAIPRECGNIAENCNNQLDDDCDGRIDANDPDCSACAEDLYEPNNTLMSARIEPGRHDGLRLCPNDLDYFGVWLMKGQSLQARTLFYHHQGDLALSLEDPTDGHVIAFSDTNNDDETLTYTASVSRGLQLKVTQNTAAAVDYVLLLETSAF